MFSRKSGTMLVQPVERVETCCCHGGKVLWLQSWHMTGPGLGSLPPEWEEKGGERVGGLILNSFRQNDEALSVPLWSRKPKCSLSTVTSLLLSRSTEQQGQIRNSHFIWEHEWQRLSKGAGKQLGPWCAGCYSHHAAAKLVNSSSNTPGY